MNDTLVKFLLAGIVFGVFLTGFAVAWALRPSVSKQDVCVQSLTPFVEEMAVQFDEVVNHREIAYACDIGVEKWMRLGAAG